MGKRPKKGADASSEAVPPAQPARKRVKTPRDPRPPLNKDDKNLVHYSSHLQVVASDIGYTSPSLLLFFDKERYLFNAGEGTQRQCREHKLKVARFDQYFFTRVSTATLGGLPGMVLSTNNPTDAGGLLDKPPCCIAHGPQGLSAYVSAFRRYLHNENTVDVHEYEVLADGAEAPTALKSDFLSMHPYTIQPHQQTASSAAGATAVTTIQSGGGDGRMPAAVATEDEEGAPAAKRRRGEHGSPAASEAAAAAQKADSASPTLLKPVTVTSPFGPIPLPPVTAYLCRLSGRPGKFDPAKAMELGVAKGPLFGDLQRGNSVVSAVTGLTVTPDQVMNPASIPGPVILVLDCPSLEYIAAIASSPPLRAVMEEAAAADGGGKLLVCAHLTPKAVAAHPQYKEWLASLHPRWQHLLLATGEDQACTLVRATQLQAKLSILHPGIFPVLRLANANAPDDRLEPSQTAANPILPPAASTANLTAAQPASTTAHAIGAVTADPVAVVPSTIAVAGSTAMDIDATVATASSGPAPTHPHLQHQNHFDHREHASAPSDAAAATHAAGDATAPHSTGPATNSAGVGPDAEPGSSAVQACSGDEVQAAMDCTGGMQLPSASACSVHIPDHQQQPGLADGAGEDEVSPSTAQSKGGRCPVLVSAHSLSRFPIMPVVNTGLDTSHQGPQLSSEAVKRAYCEAYPDVAEKGKELQRLAALGAEEGTLKDVPAALQGIDRQQFELTFLGTASSQPSKYRNVSGTYCEFPARQKGFLVDCGEDSIGQMCRRYGPAEAHRRLLQLAGVWVSHMHADHHGGLYPLLELRARCGMGPLAVMGPMALFHVLVEYSKVVPIAFKFIANDHFSAKRAPAKPLPPAAQTAYEQLKSSLGLTILQPFDVDHVHNSYGLKMVAEAGWSVVFSGDTRPSNKTVEAAKNVSLLVHEATFEDEMQEDADRKRHSTTSGAIGVAEKAGAYRTILTHFSTRYPTIPAMQPNSNTSLALAMDFMTVNLADLPWLPSVLAPLGALFDAEKDTFEEVDEVAGEE